MRSRGFPIVLAALLAVFATLGLGAALAQDAAPHIAIVDMQRILRESVAVQALQESVDEERRRYQEGLRERERALREADRVLNEERPELTQDVYRGRLRELELEAAEVQRDIQERRASIDRAFSQGIAQVQEAIVRVVSDLAEEQGLDLVLNKASVVLVEPELEITGAAITELNKRLPHVDPPGVGESD